jgi:hypothetical protein
VTWGSFVAFESTVMVVRQDPTLKHPERVPCRLLPSWFLAARAQTRSPPFPGPLGVFAAYRGFDLTATPHCPVEASRFLACIRGQLRESAGPVPTVVAFVEITVPGARAADLGSACSLRGPLGREQQRAFNSQRARLIGQAGLGPLFY